MNELKDLYDQLIARISKIEDGNWCEKLFVEHNLNESEVAIAARLSMLQLLLANCPIPSNTSREDCFKTVYKRIVKLVEDYEQKGSEE